MEYVGALLLLSSSFLSRATFSSPILLDSFAPIPRGANSSDHLHSVSQSHSLSLSLQVTHSIRSHSQSKSQDQLLPIRSNKGRNTTMSALNLSLSSQRKGFTFLDRDGLHKGEVFPIDYATIDFDVSTLIKYLNSLHRNTSLLHLLSHELHGVWFDKDLSFLMRFKFELAHVIIPSCSFELTFIRQKRRRQT